MEIPTVCCYCGGEVVLTDSAAVYGKSFGNLYLCTCCNAYVGVHRGSGRPKGTLANAVLRLKRREAHRAFDALWKTQGFTRTGAYRWLAGQMGLHRSRAHIACFDVQQCEKVIRLCCERNQKEAA